VNPEFCREVDPEPFAFSIDEHGLPFIAQDFSPGKEAVSAKKKALLPGEIPKETNIEILIKVFKINKTPKYSELLFSLKNEVESWYGYPIGEAKIKSYISYYVDNELLFKTGKSPHTLYHLKGAEPVE
jgi:DNA polymerase III delta subunit